MTDNEFFGYHKVTVQLVPIPRKSWYLRLWSAIWHTDPCANLHKWVAKYSARLRGREKGHE